ncbi:MAG TPA: ATP-dependent DNA helicase [Candidatus Saccharimonadia bacterium]
MEILEGLNEEQRRAVTHTNGPMLVVAGAGTGKTQVITRRIAYLLEQGLAKPEQILALTFTERAAREMAERLYGLIGWQSFQAPVMTFHAFGAELLSRYASHIGRSVRGGLLNDLQKTLLLWQHLDRIELEYYDPGQALYEFIAGVVDYIGQLQNAGITADRYLEFASDLSKLSPDMHPRDQAEQRDLAALYRLYEQLKVETGACDYHDQMMLPLEILRQRPNLVERLRREYRYVLVDEYQDTNPVQDQLLQTLVGKGGNIFAVGDDDQAIYGFRGADINNILSFAEHFGLSEPIVLVQNYRSGQPVLDVSYRLIKHNDPNRLEAKLGLSKRLLGQHDRAEVRQQPYAHGTAELQGVAEAIQASMAAGQSASSMAVLSATHAPLKALAKLLRSRGVPYNLSTSANIFEQPELLTVWYLLTWIAGRADEVAISHVLLGRYLRWCHEQYRRLADVARDNDCSLEAALGLMPDDAARELQTQLAQWRDWARLVPVSQLVFRLVFETDAVQRWRQEALQSQRLVRVFEDMQRWLEQMQDFESVSIDTSLVRYLQTFPEPPQVEVQEPVGDPDGIALLTVHAAKGLEFAEVYLINVTQRAWSRGNTATRRIPESLLAGVEQPAEEEYRRLFYVALTRAKQKIVVSYPMKTVSGARQTVSPFIVETFGAALEPDDAYLGDQDKMQEIMLKLQRYYPLQTPLETLKLPFEAADGWLDLSVTALAAYEFCPFEFYLEHGLRLAQPAGPQLAFGTALHRVFELYYQQVLAGQPLPECGTWHVQLDEAWSGRGYERPELAERDRQLAHQTLDRFLEREAAAHRVPVGVELPIRFELPEYKLRLRGKIDAVFQAEAGVELRDYKTGRSRTDKAKLDKAAKENFQLRTYALAYDRLGMGNVSQVVLDYVVTGVEGEAQLSATIMRNHAEKLGALAEQIRAHEFAPKEGLHTCAAYQYYGSGERDELALELWVAQESVS